MPTPIERALLSLEGLSVGDAFGECFFSESGDLIRERRLPASPWRWTDDTHMAISLVEILLLHEEIDQDALAAAFARRFQAQRWRGYGSGAGQLLMQIIAGQSWRDLAPQLFGGGSYGNGAAMRVAPLGAFFPMIWSGPSHKRANRQK